MTLRRGYALTVNVLELSDLVFKIAPVDVPLIFELLEHRKELKHIFAEKRDCRIKSTDRFVYVRKVFTQSEMKSLKQ